MIDDHGQELLSLAVADLVDADAPQSGRPVRLGVDVGADSGDDAAYGAPGDRHQLGDPTLRALRGRPCHLLVEDVGVSGAVAGAGHLPHRRTVGWAGHSWRIGLEEDPDRAQVQGAPPPTDFAAVVPGPTAAACAATPLPWSLRSDVSDHSPCVLMELGVLDDGLLDAQQGMP